MGMDDINITLGGFDSRQPPKESELDATLDSWWLLPDCESYGLSKQSLLDALKHMRALSTLDIGKIGGQFVTSPETMKLIEQRVSGVNIEREENVVTSDGPKHTKHELSVEEKTAELIALGMAFLVYVSALEGPRPETSFFGMGHQTSELVYFAPQNNLFYANLVSQNVFDLAKDEVLGFIKIYLEMLDATPADFLHSLVGADGTSKASLEHEREAIQKMLTYTHTDIESFAQFCQVISQRLDDVSFDEKRQILHLLNIEGRVKDRTIMLTGCIPYTESCDYSTVQHPGN